MKEAVITDAEGFYTGVTLVEDVENGILPLYVDEELVGYQVADRVQEGLHLPRWNVENSVWIEGKTQGEIDAINAHVPLETDTAKIARLLAENATLLAETTRLAARDSQMQDDQMFILEALVTAGII